MTIRHHTSTENGIKIPKRLCWILSGFRIIIEIPPIIKGLVKSITRSRVDVMVRGAAAMSAFFKIPCRHGCLGCCKDNIFHFHKMSCALMIKTRLDRKESICLNYAIIIWKVNVLIFWEEITYHTQYFIVVIS